MSRVHYSLAVWCCGIALLISTSAAASASSVTGRRYASLPSLSQLSKSMAQDMVAKELRRMIVEKAAAANRTAEELRVNKLIHNSNNNNNNNNEHQEEDWFPLATPFSPNARRLQQEEGDWDTLNEILDSVTINIPLIDFQQDLLGFTLSVVANGTCDKLRVGELRLDWDKGEAATSYNDTTLAYKFQILGAELRCYLDVSWNTGVLDVQDDLKIRLKVNDTNFGVALNLEGAPPTESEFIGCKVGLSIGDLKSSGGFSSDIINDLNELVVGIVRDETALITDVVCDILANFTDAIDDALAGINDILDPFLAPFDPADVDPLSFENNLPPDTPELVSFNDRTGVGNVIGVLVGNLAGIINADQINTLVEGALLDEDGVFVLVLEETLPWEQEPVPEESRFLRLLQGTNGTTAEEDDLLNTPDEISSLIPAECNPLGRRNRRHLAAMFQEYADNRARAIDEDNRRRRRRLQLDGLGENITLDDIFNTTNLLAINDIVPMNVSVTGLNNFTDGAPLSVVGDYTFNTELTLGGVHIDAVVALDVSINNVSVQEVVTLSVDVDDIFVNATYLVGLAQAEVDEWTIGTFLNTSNLLPCILSALVTAGVDQLYVTVGDIGVPVVQDVVSDGVTELLNTGVEGGACVYEQLILDAVPGFFQNNATIIINDFIDCYIEVEGANAVCDTNSILDGLLGGGGTDSDTGTNDDDVDFDFRQIEGNRRSGGMFIRQGDALPDYLDFRDLLLAPEDAKALGGSGRQQYGDLIMMAFDTLLGTVAEEDNSTGLPGINGFLGEDALEFDIELLNSTIDTTNMSFVNLLLESVKLAAYNVRAENVNTIVNPLKFLEPTEDAHTLSNVFNFGPVPDRGLNATITALFELLGTNSPLAASDEFDIGARVDEMDILADIRVLISTISFVQFPIGDLLEINCWFALVGQPSTTAGGVPNAFLIKNLAMDIVKLGMNLECVDCDSQLLPSVIDLLDRIGAFTVLGNRMGPLIEEIAATDMLPNLLIDAFGLGGEAARLCPHHSLFNTTSSEPSAPMEIEIPQLTAKSIDTVMFGGILGAELFGVVFAESYLRNNVSLSDPLSGQTAFNATGKDNLLDWYRLNETFISFDALDLARGFLGASEGGQPGVNDLFTGLLDEDGSFNLTLDLVLELIEGYEVTVDSVKVYGLDSFKVFDILEPFAPQTLRNVIEMDDLKVFADLSINATNTSDPAQPYTVSFDVSDVNATIYLFAAIDMGKVESLEIGSLLFIENILPCMLGSAYDIHVPAMRASIGNLSKPIVEGLQPDTSEAAALSLQAVFDQYESVFVEATNSIFDSTVRELVNQFVSDYLDESAICLGPESLTTSASTESPYVDFRDLLLSPADSIALGGSGQQPYGDIGATVYSLLLDQIAYNETGEYLEINSLVGDFTEGQSGVVGTARFQDKLFGFVYDEQLPLEFLDWLNMSVNVSASDARLENANTMTSPIALARPTTDPYVLDNLINFGPNSTNPLIATINTLLGIDGDLKSLNMFNKFDVTGIFEQIEIFAAISVYMKEENLFRFPLRDVLELDCWLSLFPTPNQATNTSAIDIESMLSKLVLLGYGVDCQNCTSRVLAEAVALVDGSGVPDTLGPRLGPLIDDISSTESIPYLLGDFLSFGDEAGRLCPHHPLFNTTSNALDITSTELALPPLSSLSLDTVLFIGLLFAEVSVIVGADNHLQHPGETSHPPELLTENFEYPKEALLINWTNLEEVDLPFIALGFDLIKEQLGGTAVTDSGEETLAVNDLVQGFLDENGMFSLDLDFATEMMGVELKVNTIRATGLDTFTEFNVLNATSPLILQNDISLDKLTVGLDLSVNLLETDDPPSHVNLTINMESVNMSIPIYAAVDEIKAGNLKIGSLLHLSNVLPCLLSTTYFVQLAEIRVVVGNLLEPVVEGLLPDTNEAAAAASRVLFERFGDMIAESIPLVFEDTLRVVINSYLASFDEGDCKDYSTNTTSRYIDFQQALRPSNATGFSPYGDIIPLVRDILEAELFSNDPETQMPKINDALIAPITEDQSGVAGTILLPGKIFSLDTEALSELGLGITGIELSDARVENVDTVGQPLVVAEPNKTRNDLLNNRATFGTQLNPLRFAIRASLSFLGPFIQTRDEMDIFGELRSAPIYAVALARLGAQEVLNLPLKYVDNLDCWLATLAEPALDQIAAGNPIVNPVASLDYLSIAFQSLRISASCYNCTTRGLEVVPELLEIVETTTAKNVLGYRNVELFLGLLNSDFAQVWILRFFQDSISKCEYLANSTNIDLEYDSPEFPNLNEYNMETGVFSLTVAIQTGLVVAAETIIGLNNTDPIFSDPEPIIPPGTRLVDFTELDEYPNGALISVAIDGLNSFLGEPTVDEETGEITLGINGLLGNPLQPFDQYEFEEPFDVGIAGLTIDIDGVTVSGLDTFTQFNIANITGPTLMRHKLGWERLQFDIQMVADLTGATAENMLARSLQNGVLYDPDDPDNDGRFPFTLTIELADVQVDAETFIALDYELLKYVELGDFLRIEYILPCIQATVLHLEVTDMQLEVGKVTKMQVSGWKSEDTKVASENLEETLIEKFGETIAGMAPNLTKIAGRPLVNTLINSYLRDSDFECEKLPFDEANGGFIDFRDLFLEPEASVAKGGSGQAQYGDLFSTVFEFSSLAVRFFILPELQNLEFPGALIDQGIKFDVRNFQSVFHYRVEDLRLENINSVGTLAYVEPIDKEPHMVNNTIQLGVGRNPIGIKFNVYFAFKGLDGSLKDVDISNDFEVSLDIKNLEIILAAFATVREQSFVEFPLRDMLNLDCWLATIPAPQLDTSGKRLPGSPDTLSVEQIIIFLKELNMGVTCKNCTGPDFYELNDLLQAPGASEELTRVSNLLIQSLSDRLGGDFLQDQLDRLLVEAPMRCPHTDNFDPDAPPFQFDFKQLTSDVQTPYVYYLLALVIPLLIGVAVMLVVRHIVHKRHQNWLTRLPSEQVFLIQQKQEKEDHVESEMNELTSSMFSSKEVSIIARYLVPFILVVNIGFFLSGHLSLGGRAVIDFTIAGESFRLDNFYDFSIAQSTLDLWHAGGQELAALILLFSGVWPYTKQLITLSLWFLPPSVVSVTRRGHFLMWLDILAKWSMIDIFVLLITIAGFRYVSLFSALIFFRIGRTLMFFSSHNSISGASPVYPFLPNDFYKVDLLIVPMWGLYANLIAQLMSQISSHFIVMYHRRIIRTGQRKYQERHHPERTAAVVASGEAGESHSSSPVVPGDFKKDQLCKHRFTRAHKPDGDKVVASCTANASLPAISVVLAALLVVSCILPSLRIEAYGVVGIAIELGQKFTADAVRYKSIFSTAATLVEQALYMGEIKDYLGNIFLALLFVATLLLVPVVMLATMMYMWLFPQTRERRERVAITIETLQAWQYVEVYILGILIESWQLGSISKLFLNRYCESLDPTLELMASYGIIEPKDAQCFELEASIASGAYLLIPFVFGLAIVGSYVIKAYIQYLREKHDEEEDTSEEAKLRAFDRTTWDNRENALESIRKPPVLFTDTYRWTLRLAGPGDSSTVGDGSADGEGLLGDGSAKFEEPINLGETAPAVNAGNTYQENSTSSSGGSDPEARVLVPPDEASSGGYYQEARNLVPPDDNDEHSVEA